MNKKRLPNDVQDLLLSSVADNESDKNDHDLPPTEGLELEMYNLLDGFVLESAEDV